MCHCELQVTIFDSRGGTRVWRDEHSILELYGPPRREKLRTSTPDVYGAFLPNGLVAPSHLRTSHAALPHATLHTRTLHTQPFHTQPLIREPFTRSPSTRNPSHLRTSRFTLSRRYGAPEWARGADGSEGPVEFDRVSVRTLHTSTLPEDSFLFQQEKCTHPGHISHSYFTPHTLSHCTPHFTLHVTPHTARHTPHCASHFTLHAMSIGDFELNETISGWSYMHTLVHAYPPTCIPSYMHRSTSS